MKLWNFIKEHLQKNAASTIAEEGASLSFEEAAVYAEEFAKKLHGVGCCAILCGSETTAALSLLSCFAAGVTALPLSPRYGTAHCEKILDAISPDAVITDAEGKIRIYRFTHSRYILPDRHPALIMCTSGTTGKPKGAMLGEENILTNVKDIAHYFGMKRGDTILISRPLYHCAVLTGEFLTAIVKGADIRFCSGRFQPVRLLRLMHEHRVTVFCGTPTMLDIISKFNRNSEAETLRILCISGECLRAEVAKRIRAAFSSCEIYHVYGLTEACPRVSWLPPEKFDEHPDCVGVPLRSVNIRILDKNGKTCEKNEAGTLYVKGDNVMLGYYGEPEKTRAVLRDGWLCTGDIAMINDEGLLKICGRNDDLIIRAGMNIYPAEIEETLRRDPRVREVLAYGIATGAGTEIGLKIAGVFSSVAEVKKMCADRLPAHQIPSVIELTDALEKNASGKIVRRCKS